MFRSSKQIYRLGKLLPFQPFPQEAPQEVHPFANGLRTWPRFLDIRCFVGLSLHGDVFPKIYARSRVH